MFKRIKRLDKTIANKIAAGEVVERPSSVVKEVIENSIDANANSITVEIKDAGKSYIRISDNGIGIHKDDITLAFERHATSKISNDKDIYNLNSLGFRGEALASIASVSNVEIITRTKDESFGIKAELKNGKIVYKKEVGCPVGTTIIVKDLFYNTPARYKFLKSNSSETNNISLLVNKLALSHPEISFRYVIDNKHIFTTPGNNDVYSTISSIYEKKIVKNLIKIHNVNNGIELKGFISNINYARGNRQMQAVFVNGRYVKSKVITQAINDAYKTLLPSNKYPACFLYLKIEPDKIDVNIHPAKVEIRFHDEALIRNLVLNLIRENLLKTNLIPNVGIESKKHIGDAIYLNDKEKDIVKDISINDVSKQLVIDTNRVIYKINDIELNERKEIDENEVEIKPDIQKYIKEAVEEIKIKKNDEAINEKISTNEKNFFDDLNIIGQLFSTYIICEKDNKMFLIDQHAAHERVLYEQYLNCYLKSDIVSQILLEPIIINLSYLDKEMLLQNIKIFNNLGYKVEDFGYNTVILREIPVLFGIPVAKSFFLEILENISRLPKSNYEHKIEKIVQIACKNAIKANDSLKIIEISELIKQLKELENPFTCPHGRPTIISISKGDIEKKFMRR